MNPSCVKTRLWAAFTAAAILLSPLVAAASERNYPFPRKQPVYIGDENFHPEYLSLQGLEGIYIDFQIVESSLLQLGYELPESYKEDLLKLVSDAGLEILDKETVRWSPGQPMLNIWPTVEGAGIAAGNSAADSPSVTPMASAGASDLLADTTGEADSSGHSSNQGGECRIPPTCNSSLWVGFSQSASLLRQPLREYRLSTWGAGEKLASCENRVEWMTDTIAAKIEKFVDDYKKAQQEQMPTIVSRADDLPRNCSQSWMMIDGVFDLNEATITPRAQSVLDRYVQFSADCNGFGYVVEAHDDSHADNQYNQILRTARSEGVKEVINSLGIHSKRIKIRQKNEAVPFMSGTLDSALLKGSVIVYPQSPVEFTNLDLEF